MPSKGFAVRLLYQRVEQGPVHHRGQRAPLPVDSLMAPGRMLRSRPCRNGPACPRSPACWSMPVARALSGVGAQRGAGWTRGGSCPSARRSNQDVRPVGLADDVE